jgi:alpha-amylase/alpha-mannosidase (GH57 family)
VGVRAVFLWHLHQPDYRDPQTGQPVLPWVRLHGTRAYVDMAAALEQNAHVRAVVNFAPSLLLQLADYVQGAAIDVHEQLARKPAEMLTPQERALVLRDSFAVDWDVWVRPVARYAELLDHRGGDLRKIDLSQMQAEFSAQDLRDLQVHFVLAWMGFTARREEPLVAQLVAKERGYSEEEKTALLDVSRNIAARVVPRWKALQDRGQVEITCSPLNHPILPLLVDSDSARRAMPDAKLPPRFAHPEDAREQVVRGLDVAERSFGKRPVGMWPSEGSVSPEVVDLLASCGVSWCATDEGVLARSDLSGDRPNAAEPWACGTLAMLFRNRAASDAIGFTYARTEPAVATQDLLRKISEAPDGSLVTIALDGENPWEHYRESGGPFLDALYAALRTSAVQTVLPRDDLREHPPRRRIARLHTGSWIDANFRIWIGHAEDNTAWTLLGEARDALARAEAVGSPGRRAEPEGRSIGDGSAPRERVEAARTHLLVAEGSDWFWWYGDDFTTDNAPEFDALFRRRVGQAFQELGQPAPERLGWPIIAPHKDPAASSAVLVQPRRLVAPSIDGYSRRYFEWSGAGFYRPGTTNGSSMFRGQGAFQELWFGFSAEELFLRLDPAPGTPISGELHVLLTIADTDRVVRVPLLDAGAEALALDDTGARCGFGRAGAIVEVALSRSALRLEPGQRIHLAVRVLRDGIEQDRLPRYGELDLIVPDRSFERANWQV